MSDGVLIADGLDPGVIGLARLHDRPDYVVVYDLHLCAEALVGPGLDYDSAMEYLQFNAVDAWLGPGTPVFVEPCNAAEARAILGSNPLLYDE